tara:strand:+ start:1766 stop:2020 length:255 start_codon:yes stop_codon:yes gene_type:complete
MAKKSQKDSILNYLEEGNEITPIEALDRFGCFRLADVIFKLKQEGYDIQTKMVSNGSKKYASYRLMSNDGELNLGNTSRFKYPD